MQCAVPARWMYANIVRTMCIHPPTIISAMQTRMLQYFIESIENMVADITIVSEQRQTKTSNRLNWVSGISYSVQIQHFEYVRGKVSYHITTMHAMPIKVGKRNKRPTMNAKIL